MATERHTTECSGRRSALKTLDWPPAVRRRNGRGPAHRAAGIGRSGACHRGQPAVAAPTAAWSIRLRTIPRWFLSRIDIRYLGLIAADLADCVRRLRRNMMRSALTTLGIIIGVGAVIAMVEIGQGSKSAIQQIDCQHGRQQLDGEVGSGLQRRRQFRLRQRADIHSARCGRDRPPVLGRRGRRAQSCAFAHR